MGRHLADRPQDEGLMALLRATPRAILVLCKLPRQSMAWSSLVSALRLYLEDQHGAVLAGYCKVPKAPLPMNRKRHFVEQQDPRAKRWSGLLERRSEPGDVSARHRGPRLALPYPVTSRAPSATWPPAMPSNAPLSPQREADCCLPGPLRRLTPPAPAKPAEARPPRSGPCMSGPVAT